MNLDSILKKKKIIEPGQHIKKQRCYFTNKGLSSQSFVFSSSHVWVWELDYKESWVPKNWCFWTVVLEKTRVHLDCKEIKPFNPKGNQSWIFFGRTDAEDETNSLAPWCEELTHWKRPRCWERLKAKEGDDRGWNDWMDHQLNGHEFEQALIVGNGEGSLACCSSWGLKALNMTEWLKLTELNHWTNAHSGKRVAAKWMFIPKWLNNYGSYILFYMAVGWIMALGCIIIQFWTK